NRCAAPNLLKLDSRLWFQSADRFQKTSGKRQREYCDQTNKSSGSEEENEQNRSETSFASVCHAQTKRSISSGSEFDTSRMTLPRSRFISALRCGAPRMTRDAPSVAATSTIVSAADGLTA